MEPIVYSTNPFGGVIIDPQELGTDAQEFAARLQHWLEVWAKEGFKLVWLEAAIDKAALIPVAVEMGFTFHHSGEDYLMLTRRLEAGAFIPAHASHYIGAGGVVLNQKQELLVVSEKYHRVDNSPPRYKLPGGALREGEHLVEAVVREVKEETGVETKFDALVCFRHWHDYRYGKSDIYFVCRLHPQSETIIIQEEEIAECRWMPVQDYLDAESVSIFNKHIVQAALRSPGVVPTEVEGYGEPSRYEFFMPHNLSSGDR